MFKIYKKERVINHLFSRYDISKDYFDNYLFLIKNKSVFIICKEKNEIIQKLITNKSVINVGIEIFSDIVKFRPCSLGFCVFDKNEIKQNYVILKRSQVVDHLNGKEIDVDNVSNKNILSTGYVICIYNNKVVGSCLFENNKLIPNLAFVNQKAK